ncbi:SpoIIE family protein phosphatase [Bacteroidota bacterium]
MKRLSPLKLRGLINSYAVVSSSLNSNEILKHIMNETIKLLKAEAASIFLYDKEKNELHMKVSTNLNKRQINRIKVPFGKGIVGYVAETGKLVNITDMKNDPRFYDKVDKITRIKSRSSLTVPLHVENQLVGAAQVLNKKGRKSFDKEDEILLTEFARLACITLDKAWLHEQLIQKERIEADLQLACKIQNNLLPKEILSLNGYHLKGFYKPARFVSGDYYDYFPLSEDEIFFTIADVTGKGAQASILMATVKAYLSAAIEHESSLLDVVQHLNKFFYDNSPSDEFVTMFFGVLNTTDGNLTYINAGHEPPLLIRRDKSIEELYSTGMMIGAMDGVPFDVEQITINNEDHLCAFTDGITEAMNKKRELFEIDRLKKLLLDSYNSPEDLFELIPSELKKFSKGAGQSDDITFLLVY